jgi:hypothetical protein
MGTMLAREFWGRLPRESDVGRSPRELPDSFLGPAFALDDTTSAGAGREIDRD